PGEAAAFTARARNWHNLWGPADGFLRPRNKDGSWASPNPLGVPGVWRPEFQDGWQEGTGYQYLWFVPQDVAGLAATLGGNDDTGTMAAWYVLAALGLYHAAPGSQAWELSTPAFPHTVIHLGGGKRLVFDAPGASRVNQYIQSASFRSSPFERTWLSSSDL